MSTMPSWKSKIAKLWSESRTTAAGRLPFALFICALLAYAAAFAWHMLITFDLVNLIRDANYDDSFYYFQIAYNLAQGKFSTFDGITQTNGYHPVWLLLITPFYWIFDKETALFGIKAFEIALIAGGAALIATGGAGGAPGVAAAVRRAADALSQSRTRMLLRTGSGCRAMFTLALLILAVCLYMRAPAALASGFSPRNSIRAALGSHRVHRRIACRDRRLVRYRVVAHGAALAAPIRIGEHSVCVHPANQRNRRHPGLFRLQPTGISAACCP